MTEAPDQPRTAKPARPRSLACSHCGAPIKIIANGISISAACPSCGSVLDVSTEAVRLIAEGNARTKTPLIPIGWPGTLAGTDWQVIGYQTRSSGHGSWVWEEYLLFNPYRGFRFLGQDHGHWTLYGLLRHDIPPDGTDKRDKRHYRPQDEITARTDYVLGEFYWRVRVGDTVSVREFVSPPYLLSREGGSDEVTWSRGIYLEPAVVQAAFGLRSMPPRQGTAPHQPLRPHRLNWPVALLALIALYLADNYLKGPDANRLVLSKTFDISASDQDRTLPAVAFDLPDADGNLQIEAETNVKDGLLRLDVALAAPAGARRDTSFQFGNLWGNGTQDGEAIFASVPGGAYTLLVKPHSSLYESQAPGIASASSPAPIRFTLALRRHVADPLSIGLAILAILVWPVIALIYRWLGRIGHAGA